MLRRFILMLVLGLPCSAAVAALTCEQLAAFAQMSQQLRDQGYSLPVVLAEVDKLEPSRQFTAAELDVIKGVVDLAFKGTRSPHEVLAICRDKQRR